MMKRQNDASFDFTGASKMLFDRTLALSTFDKNRLHLLHLNKLERLKTFANGEAVLYENRNPHGNPKCSAGLRSSTRSSEISACFASRNRFIEKAKSNPQLKYFFTGTFDPKKVDVSKPDEVLKHLTRFFRRRSISYMLVAEHHKSGQIHFHGLLSENVSSYLQAFDTSKRLPRYILNYLNSGQECYNFPAYAKNFGYVSVAPIRDFGACINYVSKYLTKEFSDDTERFFSKRFVCSQGLNKPEIVDASKVNFAEFKPVAYSRITPKVFLLRIPTRPAAPLPALVPPCPQCSDELPPPLKRVSGFDAPQNRYISIRS